MSEPLAESPAPEGPAEVPAQSEQAGQSEGERMAEAWAAERPNIAQELRDSRKAAEPRPPKSPGHVLLGQAAELAVELANVYADERDQERAEREVDAVVHSAERTVADYEEPEQVVYAAEDLLDTVGVDDYRFQEFFENWSETDPEAAQEFLVQRSWANHYAMEDAAYEAQAAQEQAAAEHEAAMGAMADGFVADHPDAGKYIEEMARLAAVSGVDLTGSPEEVRVALDVLREALRNLDANAEPVRGAHRSGWETSVGWEANQADNILNAGPSLRGRTESVDAFRSRMAERGFGVHADGNTVYTPVDANAVVEAANTTSAPGARVTPEEFSQREGDRLSAAWGLRPSVRDELHGKRAPRHAGAPAQEPPAGDPDDPGGFWAYHRAYS